MREIALPCVDNRSAGATDGSEVCMSYSQSGITSTIVATRETQQVDTVPSAAAAAYDAKARLAERGGSADEGARAEEAPPMYQP